MRSFNDVVRSHAATPGKFKGKPSDPYAHQHKCGRCDDTWTCRNPKCPHSYKVKMCGVCETQLILGI